MKTVFLCVAVLFSMTVSAQDFENEVPYTFTKGEDYYLLADSVNIRKTPNLKGDLTAQLSLGTKVKIVSQSTVITRLNNYNMFWYEVQFNGKQKGFVWGGKIAKTSFRSTKNPDIVFHFGLDLVKKGEYFDDSYYQIRTEQNGRQIQKYSIKGFGYALKMHTLTNHGNKGLTNVDDILYMDGFGESCGDAAGAVVLMHSAGKITEATRLDNFFDAPVFSNEVLFFPSDMEGMKDRVVLYLESGEYGETEEENGEDTVTYTEQKTTFYKWDGVKLNEVKK